MEQLINFLKSLDPKLYGAITVIVAAIITKFEKKDRIVNFTIKILGMINKVILTLLSFFKSIKEEKNGSK